jgi:hypothetical protein
MTDVAVEMAMHVACSWSSAEDTLDRCTTHLVALQGGSRAGGNADRRLRPSAFCSSMLMQGVSLAAAHATVVWPLLAWQSGASYGRGANGARAAGCKAKVSLCSETPCLLALLQLHATGGQQAISGCLQW